ncbi:putative quinol monooxygenase [Planctomonas psychrotolerans]|uniref:putative quinol monooxygenase n=1 Tax=Planctomonas psychrotolerans TaxID=2528712 RepID=UPI00123949F4|nr:putative quinol monooxygenase [Planctomonas psychrotolerans]
MEDRSSDDAGAITLVVTIPIKPDFEREFLEAAHQLTEKVRENEPDTVHFSLNRHPTETSTFVFVEVYRDSAALHMHQESEYLAAAVARLPEWLAGSPEELQLSQVAFR